MSSRRGASVSRRLFENDTETNEDCEQLNNINGDEDNEQFLNRKQEEWNFDFRNGRPLPGRYMWEPVADSGLTPSRQGNFTAVRPRAGNTESVPTEIHTTTHSRQSRSRATDTRRHSPYNLRSRSRAMHSSDRVFSPIVRYRNRDRSNSRSSNTSNERLEGDVRT